MNKKSSKTILISAWLALGAFCSVSAADLRIATVDLNKVFTNFWKTAEASNRLQAQKDERGAEFKALIAQGDKVKADYDKAVEEANDQALSGEERDKRKKAAEAKKAELNDIKRSAEQFDASSRTYLGETFRRMRDNVLSEIRAAVNAKAKEGGYDLVVDTSAESKNNDTAIFVYTSGKNDLTDAVIAELNKDAPPALLKPSGAREPEKKTKE